MAYRTTSWKNTDIGKIPSDWFFALFKDTFTKYPANSCSRDEMNNFSGVYQNIHYGDILIKYGSILDYNKYQIPFLNVDIFKKSKLLQNGDIVIADTAEDETVGKCVELLNLPQDAKILSGMHTIFCRPNNKFAPRFLGYLMNSSIYHDQLVQYITGTKVSAISKTDIDKTYILIPRIEEQQKIAAVLTDLDDLIAELENVRDKKQAIKIGAMQELLKPKKGWIKKKLEDVCDNIFAGGTPSTTKESFWKNGDIIWLPSGMIQDSVISIENATSRITQSGLVNSSAKLIKPGTTILAMTGATCGKVAYLPFEAAANQSVMAFETTKVSSKFLFYVFLNNKDYVLQFQAGGAQAGINKTSCKNFEFSFPATKGEQTAIANVLSDMDNEISAINDKINKYKQIKAGVADELLSGRIRLIQPQE